MGMPMKRDTVNMDVCFLPRDVINYFLFTKEILEGSMCITYNQLFQGKYYFGLYNTTYFYPGVLSCS